jgi:hypothetical protein
MKKIFFSALIAFTAFTACTKHAGDVTPPPVAEEATITFASPTQGGVYAIGDSVTIQATCISANTLHGCDIIIRKAADTTVLYNVHMHDHAATLNISRKWKADLTEATNLEVIIKAAINHDGKAVSKKVNFRVQ